MINEEQEQDEVFLILEEKILICTTTFKKK